MSEFAFKSAVELASAIAAKQVSSLELTDMYISRVESIDPEINSVVVKDFERGRQAARAADAAVAEGKPLGPLHGVPMTIKEAYDIEGLPTTWGIPEFKNNIATKDSATVVRMKQAGAHFFGKTNVPLSLADFQSFNEIYGTTNNPWNLERTPGGSSGGSSAALAAGLTGLEAGSDIGGSIRNPAHFCGIYGHKPTWGIVSDSGHALPGQVAPADIAVVGPMGRSAEDLKVSMEVTAGAAAHDAAGWQLNLPKPSKNQLRDFRVAIWTNDNMAPVSQEISDRVQLIGDTLSRLGATVSDSARPDINLQESHDTYSSLLWGVMAAEISEEQKLEYQAASEELDPNDHSIAADLVRYSVQPHGTWAMHNNKRFLIRQQWRRFFNDWDIVICPQTATTAFPQDQGEYLGRTLLVDNVAQDYFQQVFWSGLVTVAHLPSTVFPTGLSQEGLPIGLQAVGAEFNDYVTIDFTRLMAEEIGGFIPPPAYA
ncbi:MAG: amidase [Gammaproteobacteria bacterium]|jgi:amidase|nr:amidase [Gammaproteobacteria bacterium]MBT5203471.1 amidase [Gammaproteobacteria bacterium]MBT5601266.1 amidase [Gammaproteobacteria bacterium]MBT6245695.1 amidase [Gammaproteobacteria bacterium]